MPVQENEEEKLPLNDLTSIPPGIVEPLLLREPHSDISPELFSQRWITGARARMVVFLLLGAAMMVVHDRFYTFLAGRSVSDSPQSPFASVLHASFSNQAIANAVGNLIAYGSRVVFGSAIGVAFVQMFWKTLRGKGLTIGQMDTAMTSKDHPFDPTTWSAIIDTSRLALMAFLAALMTILTIVTPGSLTVTSLAVNAPCTVPVTNLSDISLANYFTFFNDTTGTMDSIGISYAGTNSGTKRFITQVLMSGSYIPPPNPCGICEYNMSFVAPAIQCSNITDDVMDLLPEALPTMGTNVSVLGSDPFPNVTFLLDPIIVVWNASYKTGINARLGIEVFTRNLKVASSSPESENGPGYGDFVVGDNAAAATCSAFSATYHTFVQHNLTSTISVTEVEIGEAVAFNYTESMLTIQSIGLADTLFQLLNGTLTYIPGALTLEQQNSVVALSPLGGTSYNNSEDVPWTFQPGGPSDVALFLPSLMQNISLSLLSVATGASASDGVSTVNETCTFMGLRYVYDREKLLLTYGGALFVTFLCVAVGFQAAVEAGTDETISFSRLLSAFLNEELFNCRTTLSTKTTVVARRGPNGVWQVISK